MDATAMKSTIQRRATESVALSAIKVNSVKLAIAVDSDTGKLIARRLEVDLKRDEDAINAVESELIEHPRVPSARYNPT